MIPFFKKVNVVRAGNFKKKCLFQMIAENEQRDYIPCSSILKRNGTIKKNTGQLLNIDNLLQE